ncbi:MAG TPA: DUF2383 domain-containing protein [Polyangiaceae bacterium]|jgi:hypothetical protein|nr:DUF2383 domain-containing protein [Polyangiaceae bacterium]
MDSRPEVHDTKPDVAKVAVLADFCRDEIAAAETYKRALALLPLQRHSDLLSRCFASHQQRVRELRDRIVALGGKAPDAPGVWGSLIPALTSAAAAVSENLAVSMLEEAEGRGMRRYGEHLGELDPASRAFVDERIIPGQATTHAAMSALKMSVSASA